LRKRTHGGARKGAGRPALIPEVKNKVTNMVEAQPKIQEGLGVVADHFPELLRKMCASVGNMENHDQREMAKFLVRIGVDLLEESATFIPGAGDEIIKKVRAVEIEYGDVTVDDSDRPRIELIKEVGIFREVASEMGESRTGDNPSITV
jgi:hypothetical protein